MRQGISCRKPNPIPDRRVDPNRFSLETSFQHTTPPTMENFPKAIAASIEVFHAHLFSHNRWQSSLGKIDPSPSVCDRFPQKNQPRGRIAGAFFSLQGGVCAKLPTLPNEKPALILITLIDFYYNFYELTCRSKEKKQWYNLLRYFLWRMTPNVAIAAFLRLPNHPS